MPSLGFSGRPRCGVCLVQLISVLIPTRRRQANKSGAMENPHFRYILSLNSTPSTVCIFNACLIPPGGAQCPLQYVQALSYDSSNVMLECCTISEILCLALAGALPGGCVFTPRCLPLQRRELLPCKVALPSARHVHSVTVFRIHSAQKTQQLESACILCLCSVYPVL